MKNKMKRLLRKWLGVEEELEDLECRIGMLECLLLHRDSRLNGYGVLKRHLQPPDKPLPNFGGKEIEQD